MKVYELIKALQEMPPDLPVWHDGGGDPYCAGEVVSVYVVDRLEGMKLLGHNETPERWVEMA